MNGRSQRARRGLLAASLATLAGCAALPGGPGPARENWVPSVSPSPIGSADADSPLGFTQMERSAVRVRNDGCDEYATGTGFILDDHTIVTNHHVVADYATLEVTLSDGTDISVESSAYTSIADLGLITTVESLAPFATLSDSNPQVGDGIVSAGYPGGDELSVRYGTILQVVDDPLDHADFVYETTNIGKPGSSGSAVYSDAGSVIGVLYAGSEDEERTYIIPVSLLHDMLANPSLQTANPPACTL